MFSQEWTVGAVPLREALLTLALAVSAGLPVPPTGAAADPPPISAAAQPASPGNAGFRSPDNGTYRPPVQARVRDPFRMENGPYGAGNRGIEYATAEGDPIGAVGVGIVAFAGPVAGTLHVTVRHPDGLRSSYSHLGSTSATVGQTVAVGDVIGAAGSRPFHLGVRDGNVYVDPALLFDEPDRPLVPRLIADHRFGR